MATVEVPQGTSQRAAGGDTFKFPYMDSCLGVICFLTTGAKCAAHLVSTDENGEAAQMLALKARIAAEHGADVSRILVTGNTDGWGGRGQHIESLFTLAHRFPVPAGLNEAEGYRYLVQHRSILSNEDRAKNALSGYFNCPVASITVIPQSKSPMNLYEAAGAITEEECA